MKPDMKQRKREPQMEVAESQDDADIWNLKPVGDGQSRVEIHDP